MGMEDRIALTGDWDDRVVQLLRMARHYARVAQTSARPHRRHKEDVLFELDGVLTDQIAALGNADEDDKADAEESGDAERARRAYYPLRAA